MSQKNVLKSPVFKLFLASASPRRKQLLTEVGLRFKVKIPNVDETPKRGELPDAMVRRLAYLKANRILESLSSKERTTAIVLAADTIVVTNRSKILGKPKDRAEAKTMLMAIQGKEHWVWSGYCLLSSKHKSIGVVQSKVRIRRLNFAEIKAYLKTGESYDKAGSYAVQGFGMGLVEAIQGSYTNVVGLPIAEVLTSLKSDFGVKLYLWI